MKRRFATLMFALLMSVSALALVPQAMAGGGVYGYVPPGLMDSIGGFAENTIEAQIPRYRGEAFPTYDYEAVCKRAYKLRVVSSRIQGHGVPGTGIAGGGIVPPGGLKPSPEMEAARANGEIAACIQQEKLSYDFLMVVTQVTLTPEYCVQEAMNPRGGVFLENGEHITPHFYQLLQHCPPLFQAHVPLSK